MRGVVFNPAADFSKVVPRLVANGRGGVLHLGSNTSQRLAARLFVQRPSLHLSKPFLSQVLLTFKLLHRLSTDFPNRTAHITVMQGLLVLSVAGDYYRPQFEFMPLIHKYP